MTLTTTHDLPRFGLKGKLAADWLATQGLHLPQQPNHWCAQEDGSRILRLGRGEYLVEGDAARRLVSVWQDGQVGLYRVPRYDAGFVLNGPDAAVRLSEICALDLRPAAFGEQVLMTLAAGISVTLVYEAEGCYRLWCDATYGAYMQATLQQILA